MKRINIARVVDARNISPNMIRIRLRSEMIRSFPEHAEGGHIKLIVPEPSHSEKDFARFLRGLGVRKRMRTYTVRHLYADIGEIDVDFVAHGESGPASAWALSASEGDFIGLSMPGASKMKPSDSGNYLVAVDMTAFPAAAAAVEALPETAKGDIYAEILSEGDIQPIKTPPGMNLHWILNDAPGRGSSKLVSAVRERALSGDESIFVAGEFQAVGNLRNYFRQEKAYPKNQLYISSYWKYGLIESEHKRVKTLVA